MFGFDVRGRRVNGKFVPNPDSDLHPIIMKISPGSPAAKAGLAVDDVILTVNGKDVSPKTNGEKVTVEGGMLLGKPEAGVTYIYRIRRGDTEFEVPITAVACPPDTSASTRS